MHERTPSARHSFLAAGRAGVEDRRAMIAPAEAPESAPRPSWLDRWFEPPWRAFLSWIVLATAMGWVLDHGGRELIKTIVDFIFDQLNTMLPAPLPPAMREFAAVSDVVLLLFWFEPLVLRLNLLRGLVWLGLRCSLVAAAASFGFSDQALLIFLAFATSSILCVAVLHGWRTRPWMSVPGGVLMAGIDYYFEGPSHHVEWWLWSLAITFPYAAALIFGTRLIPRAAPETPGGGRLRW